MIHLVLDSSVFRKSPKLDSREFLLLSEMMDQNEVTLHVPYVVEREFITALQEFQRTRLIKAISSLSKVLDYEPTGKKTKKLKPSLKFLEKESEKLVSERASAFMNWMKRHKAIRHDLTLSQANRALEAYFKGEPPLKSQKSRNDIPDSFIFQQVIDLKKTYGKELEIVVEDGALRTACEGAAITCWEDFPGFIRSPNVQEFLAEKIIKENGSVVRDHVLELSQTRTKDIGEKLESALLSKANSILYDGGFPGESGEIYVSGVYSPYNVEINDIVYFGKWIFMASVCADVELMYEYYLPVHDAVELYEDGFAISPVNDHYCEVETTDVFRFSSLVELEFPDPDSEIESLDELKSVLQNPSFNVVDTMDFELLRDID